MPDLWLQWDIKEAILNVKHGECPTSPGTLFITCTVDMIDTIHAQQTKFILQKSATHRGFLNLGGMDIS